jgi:hypothetical protein
MLALVFQVSQHIELNMVEEKVVILGFSRETLTFSYLINSSTMWFGIEDCTTKRQGAQTRI